MQDRQGHKLPATTSYDAVSNARVRQAEAESHQPLALEAERDGVALLRCPDLCMILDTPKGASLSKYGCAFQPMPSTFGAAPP